MRTLLLLGFSAVLLAEPTGAEPMPDEFVVCETCHGVDLRGNEATGAPRLGGLAPWAVANQFEAFRAGWRGGYPDEAWGMRLQALAMDAESIARASSWAASTDSPKPLPTVDGDVTRGKTLYGTCVACHGALGEGLEVHGAPALPGQNDWYLLRQLEAFATDRRGAVAGDERGARMRVAAAVLDDDAARRDVVAYLATLGTMTTD